MKKIMYHVFAACTFVFVLPQQGEAQCNAEQYTSACIPKLPEGFNFLKSYKVNGQGGAKSKIEYSYVFTKGTQYMINVCNDGENTDGIIITIYDSDRNKVVSSKLNDQYVSAIAYPCKSTGIYYIQYTFENSQNYCGGSVMGFKR